MRKSDEEGELGKGEEPELRKGEEGEYWEWMRRLN